MRVQLPSQSRLGEDREDVVAVAIESGWPYSFAASELIEAARSLGGDRPQMGIVGDNVGRHSICGGSLAPPLS